MMKKTLIVLTLLVFVLPLSACGLNSKGSNDQHQTSKVKPKVKKDEALIKKNQTIWTKLTKDAEVVKTDAYSGDSIVPTKLSDLKKAGNIVKGTVYNLEQMDAPKNMALTKAKIRIDQVLSGDKSLTGKDYYVVLRGGLTTTDVYYADMNRTKEVDHDILVENPEAPLPKIGTQFITVLDKNNLANGSEYSQILMKSGFTKTNSLPIFDEQFSFWIKDKTGKYVLNNPKASTDLEDLTWDINHNYA
ncbi:hypothetical protein [Companilactobacillus nantensis]|uniref:Lipoprotein n=1 Tax=Companilactobacillus nantensis DSM 16982 TaxID=1423774 RepID=A0A0R1WA00_9LACO|nr:hypothetical protein [Companilactobacillus nantensis]KRM14782.1 hypothetical protein FD31_GL001641 [Companilactobacillus nantensis DSM 16982]